MTRAPLALLVAALALSAAPAAAGEVFGGLLAHGVSVRGAAPPGFIYEGTEEGGTQDLTLGWRSEPLGRALRPRLTAKAQVNLAGRTSFFSAGAEWRQGFLRERVYAQIGIGVAYQTGYRFTPDPFAPGLTPAERARRVAIYDTRTSFGSSVLFNPNASLGLRLTDRLAVEAVWEHYSHARLFSSQNPGIENFGARLVWRY